MLKKEKENWGITLYTVEDDDYFKQWKKIWSGARTCAGAISIKSCLSLLALLANCRSQLVSGLGREKLKVVLFYLTWVSNIFDSFDAHSFVHCSSIRSMHIHSLLDFFFLKYHCNIVEGLKGSKCLARPGPSKLWAGPIDSYKYLYF